MLLKLVEREQQEAELKSQQLAEEKLQLTEEKKEARKSQRENPTQALIKSAARSIRS